ncbi:MAG: RNA methyltransferase [bacterium]|nr:RNA methyltransferase [bacterium]
MLPVKLRAHITKLQQKKYRRLHNEFIVEGLKGVEEAIKKNGKVLFIVVEENYYAKNKIKNILKILEKRGINIFVCEQKDISRIKTTATYPGISAIIKAEIFSLEDLINSTPILAFDKINDPGNLGTIMRTAEWFGVNNILISEDSVDPYNDKCVRSTMGSIFNSKIFLSDNLVKSIKLLKDKGYKIVSLDIIGDDIELLRPIKKTVYLFGSESHGLSPELEKFIDRRYTIKGKGNTESLNISVSASILLSKLEH